MRGDLLQEDDCGKVNQISSSLLVEFQIFKAMYLHFTEKKITPHLMFLHIVCFSLGRL